MVIWWDNIHPCPLLRLAELRRALGLVGECAGVITLHIGKTSRLNIDHHFRRDHMENNVYFYERFPWTCEKPRLLTEFVSVDVASLGRPPPLVRRALLCGDSGPEQRPVQAGDPGRQGVTIIMSGSGTWRVESMGKIVARMKNEAHVANVKIHIV